MTHPEQQKDEIYLGNCIPEKLQTSWMTKRLGVIAYDVDGNIINYGLKPWFIKRSEVQEAIDREEKRTVDYDRGKIEIYKSMLND